MKKEVTQCAWPGRDALMIKYHDEEWGRPCRDDKKLFEYMVLDTFQAGLSWQIILHKRENFRRAFAGFDAARIARFGKRDVARLMRDKGIIRNRQKIEATVANARAYLATREVFGSFARYIWQFVKGRPIVNKWKRDSQLRSTSPESNAMSKDMRQHGFKFVGSTICHAFMQGAGLINDHIITCFRH